MKRRGAIRVIKDRLGRYKVFECSVSTEGIPKGASVDSLEEAYALLRRGGVTRMPEITKEWTLVDAPAITDSVFDMHRVRRAYPN